jgi:aspartate kinase
MLPAVFPIVMKFGGAALTDGPGVLRVSKIVQEYGGARPIVVVSAHYGVTDLLETVARSAAQGHLEGDRVRIRHRTLLRQLGQDSELLDRYFSELFHLLAGIRSRGRLQASELDLVLSYGERMSARIVAHALRELGTPATPVDAFDLGLTTDSNHGEARPLPESQAAIRAAMAEVPGVPVVTGFLAKDKLGNLTTLGRNGSDLTAALVAEAVGAEELQLWKAVGGMMTADPRIVPEARVIERIGFAEAAEYAFHGAEVLLAAALVPAQRANLSVRVLDVNDPSARGTLLATSSRDEGPVGIAARRKIHRLHLPLVTGELRVPRIAELAAVLARHRVDPGLFSGNAEGASLLVPPAPGLEACLAELGSTVRVEQDLALAAVIGKSAGYDSDVALRAQNLLAEARVEVIEGFVGSRSPSQAFLVSAGDLERAVRALHAGLLQRQGVRV